MLNTALFVAFVAHGILWIGSSPVTPSCGEFEVPDPCIGTGCYKERTCSDILRPMVDCTCAKECNPGCRCKEGYLMRDDDYECIPRNQCPEKLKCPGQYEMFSSCVTPCNEHYRITCDKLLSNETISECPFSENEPCAAKCVCEHGFYKNKFGDCVQNCYGNVTANEKPDPALNTIEV